MSLDPAAGCVEELIRLEGALFAGEFEGNTRTTVRAQVDRLNERVAHMFVDPGRLKRLEASRRVPSFVGGILEGRNAFDAASLEQLFDEYALLMLGKQPFDVPFSRVAAGNARARPKDELLRDLARPANFPLRSRKANMDDTDMARRSRAETFTRIKCLKAILAQEDAEALISVA